ncbi:MAG: C1 family peptidase, partial [Actinomycetota bacterium]
IFPFGKATDRPIVGDWDGDGDDEPGVIRGNVWYLADNSPPTAVPHIFAFGKASDVVVVGDWNGDGRDTPGVHRNAPDPIWYLSNTPSALVSFSFKYAASPPDLFLIAAWKG